MHAGRSRGRPLAFALLFTLGATGILSIASAPPTHAQTPIPWNPTTDYPGSNIGSCVVSGGYEYCNTGYYAALSSSGVGPWMRTTPNPLNLYGQSCAAYGRYIYCVGGTNGTPVGVTDAVDYASLSSSGIGSWTNTTNYPDELYGASCTASQGFIYCLGGDETIGAVETNIVASAPISSSGVGTWSSANDYPQQVIQPNCVISGAYLYCVGGDGAADLGYTNLAYYASITGPSSGGGAIGAWSETTSYPTSDGSDLSPQSCVVTGGYVYCLGGSSNSDQGDSGLVYYASLSSSGIGQWQNATQYPTGPAVCATYEAEIDCMTGNSSAFFASISEISQSSASSTSVGSSTTSASDVASSSDSGLSTTASSQPDMTTSSQDSGTQSSIQTSVTSTLTSLTSVINSSVSNTQSSTHASSTSLGPSFLLPIAVLISVLTIISLGYRSRCIVQPTSLRLLGSGMR